MQPDLPAAASLLNYGLQSHLGAVASLLNLRLDQMLMSVLLAPAVLGFYAVAVTLSAGVQLGGNTLAQLALPYLAAQADPQSRARMFGKFVRAAGVLSVGGAAALYALTPALLRILFGEAYLPATGPARILILATIPLGCSLVLAAGFKAFGRPLVTSVAEVVSLGVSVVVLGFLLPRYQATGAALASLLAYSCTFLYLLLSLPRSLQVPVAAVLRPTADDARDVAAQARRAFEGLRRPFERKA
jgi:O-antigen/teichoic acid export membrane protein